MKYTMVHMECKACGSRNICPADGDHYETDYCNDCGWDGFCNIVRTEHDDGLGEDER